MSEHDSVSTLEVLILDKAYRISCPEREQDSLRQAALYLDKKMRDIRGDGKIIGLERVAVIAALNIAHELFNANRVAKDADVDRAALAQLLGRIDQTLAQHNS